MSNPQHLVAYERSVALVAAGAKSRIRANGRRKHPRREVKAMHRERVKEIRRRRKRREKSLKRRVKELKAQAKKA